MERLVPKARSSPLHGVDQPVPDGGESLAQPLYHTGQPNRERDFRRGIHETGNSGNLNDGGTDAISDFHKGMSDLLYTGFRRRDGTAEDDLDLKGDLLEISLLPAAQGTAKGIGKRGRGGLEGIATCREGTVGNQLVFPLGCSEMGHDIVPWRAVGGFRGDNLAPDKFRACPLITDRKLMPAPPEGKIARDQEGWRAGVKIIVDIRILAELVETIPPLDATGMIGCTCEFPRKHIVPHFKGAGDTGQFAFARRGVRDGSSRKQQVEHT